jgi:probable HAF family extracellular repeat protein
MSWSHSKPSSESPPEPGLRLALCLMPRATRSPRGAVLLLAVAFASACHDELPTEAAVDSDTCASADCAVSGATAAVVVPSSAVAIAPNAVSTTGIPMLILPAGLRTPIAMNNNHLVLGNGTSPTHGFNSPMLWSGGTSYQDLMPDRPYTAGAWGYDINDAGAITGSGGNSFAGQGFVLDNGVLHHLPTPPRSDGTGFRGDAIASDGTVLVFYHRNSPGGNTGAVIRPPYAAADYTAIPLGDPGGTTLQHVNGTDVEAGVVTGAWSGNAWRWTPGEPTLTLLPGTFADATNGTDIVGRALFDGVIHAAMLTGAAQDLPQDLGTLGGWSVPDDINDAGWVAGTSLGPDNVQRAFAWRPADGIIDLGTVDGGGSSRAHSIDDHGHVLGAIGTSAPIVVIWFLPTGSNSAPEIQPILSQTATVGEPFTLEPIVTDAENDPYTLSWTGDVPTAAVINGIFSWTPTAADVGDYEITVTATQVSDPALFDSETFVLSVLPAAAPNADLRVTLVADVAQRRAVGDAVAYAATVHNAGPDPVVAALNIALQFRDRDQATWGDTPEPPNGVINGIFSLDLGVVAAGQTVQVPFEAVFNAFGTHGLTATIAGNHNDTDPSNDAAVFVQVVDLPLTTTGVEFGILTVPGTHTSDGLPLAVVGVRVPASLVAGSETGMPPVFVPTTLTPTAVLSGGQSLSGVFASGDNFLPGNRTLPGGQVIAGDELLSGEEGAGYLPTNGASGDYFIPPQTLWVAGAAHLGPDHQAAGRLLFKNGAATNLLVQQGGAGLTIGGVGASQLAVLGAGGSADASAGFCANSFKARLGDGDAATFACGSLTVNALAGEVVIELADGTTIAVRTGASIHITEAGTGGFDIDQLSGSESDVTVTPPAGNSAPHADAGGPYVVKIGGSFAVDGGGSSDPDDDALTFAWVLDDGSPTGVVAEGQTATLVAPAAAGLYALALTVTDPSGATSSATVEVAVYDPDAASVTGGGWFHSPAGSLHADPAAAGRATFAFHLGYRKGKSVPEGHARLAFEAGDLRLTSESFDWLVVANSMARFRGVGQIHGRATPVLFEIVGRDPDELRVRIWDDAAAIYDSGDVQIGGGRVIVKN